MNTQRKESVSRITVHNPDLKRRKICSSNVHESLDDFYTRFFNLFSLRKPKKREKNIEKYQLRFPIFVLGAQVLVTAFAAAGCADRIAGVAMHTYLYVE